MANRFTERASLGLIGLWVLLMLVGCAGAVAPTAEPITIVFAYPTGAGDDPTAYYEALARTFHESRPMITVELHPMDEEMMGYGRARLIDVSGADVIMASAFELAALRQQSEILSLQPFIDQGDVLDMADFYPGAVDAFTSEGDVWAIPAQADVMVMFYNRDLFDAVGAPYPSVGWTWEDFLSAALVIRDPDAGVFGYVSDAGRMDCIAFIYQHGGRLFDDLWNPVEPTFDDPLTVEAVEWYAALTYEHHVSPTPEQARMAFGTSDNYYALAVIQEQAGMWPGLFGSRGGRENWSVEWAMSWGMAPLPSDKQAATFAYLDGYAISAQSEHPDAAWEWVAFLSKEGWVSGWRAPVRRSIVESDAYAGRVGEEAAWVVRASLESAGFVSGDARNAASDFQEDMMVFFEAIQEIMAGRATPDQALAEAQEQAERN